jgi:hypothetical protein
MRGELADPGQKESLITIRIRYPVLRSLYLDSIIGKGIRIKYNENQRCFMLTGNRYLAVYADHSNCCSTKSRKTIR